MLAVLIDAVLIANSTDEAAGFPGTIEITPEFAEYFFGQKDHVRLFGTDIVEWFHRAGFQGEPIDHKIILSELDAMSVGCNHREPFFAFTK
mgnify:CR=1 FL=1